MKKFLFILFLALFISSCASIPGLSPQPTPIPFATITPVPSATVPKPSPTILVDDLLTQQVANDLSTYPRPACEAGKQNGNDWEVYRQGLSAALRRLFLDTRSQSLSLQTLGSIFKKASGVTIDVYESNTDATLVSVVNANCALKIGGGASPYSPRDTVYVVNRRGNLWQIAFVANVIKATWATDHWIVLVTKTDYGGGSDFEIWNIKANAGEWKTESVLKFSQIFSAPLPRLSADGNSVTLYATPLACNLPKNTPAPNSIIESEYKLQNDKYQCITSRILPTPTPTK